MPVDDDAEDACRPSSASRRESPAQRARAQPANGQPRHGISSTSPPVCSLFWTWCRVGLAAARERPSPESRLTSLPTYVPPSTQPSTSSQVQSDCCLCCPGPGIVCLCRPLLSCRVPVTRCGVNCVFSVLCAPRHPIQPKSPENWTPEATTSRSVLDPGLSDRASPHTETHNTHLTNRTVLDQPSPDRAALALTSRPRT